VSALSPPQVERPPASRKNLPDDESVKGSFVDIDDRGARAEVAVNPEKTDETMVTVTKGFTLDGAGWKRLVGEVDAMIEREGAS
jgi:hypothetical protein